MGYGRLTIHRVQQHLTYGKKEEKAYKKRTKRVAFL